MDEHRIPTVDLNADRAEAATMVAVDAVDEPKPNVARPQSKYVREFESLFMPIRAEMLKNRAQSGQLRRCQFRSLCWRYFLRCLPEQCNDWPATCETRRREYEALRKKNLDSIKPEMNDDKQNSASSNPSNSSGSSSRATSEVGQATETTHPKSEINFTDPKHQQSSNNGEDDDDGDFVKLSNQCDHKSVLRTIERDVVRTFPDMEFFRGSEIQEILSNILFNFATENPHLSYKQGMHELLATLLYVAHTDSQNCLINYEGDYANETIASLLNIKYLEHDVYLLFSNLMKTIETWYQNDEILIVQPEKVSSKTSNSINRSSQSRLSSSSKTNNSINRFSQSRLSGSSSTTSKLTTSKPQVGSVLGSKLMRISVNIVKSHDPELFYHLEALQIAPQIFGIRWMRLLFGREFEFLDLLAVWDAIICDQDSMSLVDYVFASMLITIREELVNGDYTHCLNNLMRYQFKDVKYVIKLALYLRDPINYSCPEQPVKPHGLRYSGTGQQRIQSSQRIPPPPPPPPPQVPAQSPKSKFNVSTESYADLHSIVDYCWRLLSEQIDSLQRCLPKEKGLNSEDEIFVALAQLKKVRDVLKGSLRLEDELESAGPSAPAAGSRR